jgi:hypothetical protein
MDNLLDGIRGAIDGADEAAASEAGGTQEAQESEESHEAPAQDQEETVKEDGGGEPETEEAIDWNRVNEFPVHKLPPGVAKLRSDRDRLASEAGEMRKRLAELEARTTAAKKEGPADDKPEDISADDDAETIQRKVAAIASWHARQQSKAMESKLQALEEREEKSRMETAQRFLVDQASRIERSDGYSQEVGSMMSALAGQNPGWREALGSEEGWTQLFDYARYIVGSQAKKTQDITRKATAKQREVPRAATSAKGASKDIQMPDNDGGFESQISAILDDFDS